MKKLKSGTKKPLPLSRGRKNSRRLKMKKMLVLLWVLLTVGTFDLSTSFAARPLVTEDAGTVEKGSFELELAFDFLREENDDKDSIPSLQLKYGLLERMEAGALIGYIFREPREDGRVDGWSDLVAYLKYRFWDEGQYYPAFALKPQVKIPTASERKDLGSGKADYGLTAIFSKPFSNLTVHFDVTYFLMGNGEDPDVFTTGLAAEYAFLKGWTAVGEIRYGNNFNTFIKDDPLFANAGLKVEVGPATFDAAVNAGLNGAAPKYGFTVGVTLRFK